MQEYSIFIDLLDSVFFLPHVDQFAEHTVRTTTIDLAQSTKYRELIIRHPHIILQERGAEGWTEGGGEGEREKEREREQARANNRHTAMSIEPHFIILNMVVSNWLELCSWLGLQDTVTNQIKTLII